MDQDQIKNLHLEEGADPDSGALGQVINSVGIIFAIGILISAAILILEIFLRYVLNAPTIWAHETVIFLNASAFVFGGLYVVSRNSHIRVVLIYDYLSKPVRRHFDIAISLTSFLASVIFAWAAWQGVKRAIWTPAGDFRLETSGSAWNPPTPGLLKVFLLIILCLMAIQFLVLAVSYYKKKDS
ncbi:TRAP transporter small permease subunit [Falsihalocynthiibacter arcticus]|uniref:TRAP transporter small permease protein n=1 Tax=Falsihalocynthiibacter arcticus TaxID=1579316 RepID=A0A126V1E3_9RHOB|nr:TRAP transporter small permease [Falsihalocynthiibacter arcticus]AML52152.1 C4-dicarboxylate ABC transporter permease [Falsihalocynthiibacter arcticus]